LRVNYFDNGVEFAPLTCNKKRNDGTRGDLSPNLETECQSVADGDSEHPANVLIFWGVESGLVDLEVTEECGIKNRFRSRSCCVMTALQEDKVPSGLISHHRKIRLPGAL
jgi:hypothetical protein